MMRYVDTGAYFHRLSRHKVGSLQRRSLANPKTLRLEHVSLSYNGGKDCLVLLILILACLPALETSTNAFTSDTDKKSEGSEDAEAINSNNTHILQALYIVSSKPFAEVEDFVATTSKEYHLDLDRYALAMRPALDAYLSKKQNIKAIFMGTRRTDPHAELLTHFDVTDKDWPQFMRVHPVIDWHYVEIWAVCLFRFLRRNSSLWLCFTEPRLNPIVRQ